MEHAKSTTDYPYRVVYPSQALLTERGFGRVARLPFIMDSRPGYHRLANQFLIDLGLGAWSLATRGRELASNMPPTKATMHNYAHWLSNYLEYCHVRGKDPLKASYQIDLIQGYRLFSHKSYLVIPSQTPQDELARVDSLCEMFGLGLVTFNPNSLDAPNFTLVVRPLKQEPDLFYTNRYIKHVEKELFS